jgi:hypothetical protein
MDAITKKPKLVPLTIERLKTLQPGEEMTIYKGDFDLDLVNQEGAPKYATLLQRVHKTMRALEREGRIVLRVEHEAIKWSKGKIVAFKKYVAIGV